MPEEKKRVVCTQCGEGYLEGSPHNCQESKPTPGQRESVKKLIEKFEKELGKK